MHPEVQCHAIDPPFAEAELRPRIRRRTGLAALGMGFAYPGDEDGYGLASVELLDVAQKHGSEAFRMRFARAWDDSRLACEGLVVVALLGGGL